MNLWSNITAFFSLYADKREKIVANFLLKEAPNGISAGMTKARLLQIMQEDLIRLTVYSEWKFKGYKNLRTGQRRYLYEQADLLVKAFDSFVAQNKFQIPASLNKTSFSEEKKQFVAALMAFFRPGENFIYQESTSFSRLLRDPAKESPVGDCNQVCTLYLALYATRYPLDDWKIHLLPGHVCLHWDGVDIECTSASIGHYDDQGEILPVQEIVTTNILDIKESRLKTHSIPAKDFAAGARFVASVSSHKALAQKNLKIAYHNLAVSALNEKNFSQAIAYFRLAGKEKKELIVWQQAAQYYVDQKNFSQAKKAALRSDSLEVRNFVVKREGAYFLEKKNFKKALSLFEQVQAKQSVRAQRKN